MRDVAAAANNSATIASSAWCPPVASQRSAGKGCSVTNVASNPASSPATASSVMADTLASSSKRSTRWVGSWTATFMRTPSLDGRILSHSTAAALDGWRRRW